MSSAPRPPAGSSSSSSRGSATSARASATRFWTAYGRLSGQPVGDVGDAERVERLERARAQRALVAVRARQAEQRRAEPGAGVALAPTITFSTRGEPVEQADALQRARDAAAGELVRAHAVAASAPAQRTLAGVRRGRSRR